MTAVARQDLPLVVDLDGTLTQADTLHETLLDLIKRSPGCLLLIPYWLWKGKAYFKEQIAVRAQLNVDLLPFNKEFVQWLQEEKTKGRYLILCTAANKKIAEIVSKKINLFDEILSSDNKTNIAGDAKAALLNQRFGSKQYDYAGNSKIDLRVWRHANAGILITSSKILISKAKVLTKISKVFEVKKNSLLDYAKFIRLHQWLKNLLLFVPIVAAHELSNVHKWALLIGAFFSFSLCASFVYILNDLFDVENDRSHPKKRERLLANGQVSIPRGILIALCMLLLSILIAINLAPVFQICLFIYFLATCLYTILVKRIAIFDCLVLAFLYTLRIISGVLLVGDPLSFWLLAFSLFLFLSLAFVKRYAELALSIHKTDRNISGRGYVTSDAPLIQTMGVVAGYISVLVLALYLNSEAVLRLYRSPQMIWFGVCILLFWISWVWMQAQRGKMNDDPLIFAIKDRVSVMSGALFMGVLILGTIGF